MICKKMTYIEKNYWNCAEEQDYIIAIVMTTKVNLNLKMSRCKMKKLLTVNNHHYYEILLSTIKAKLRNTFIHSKLFVRIFSPISGFSFCLILSRFQYSILFDFLFAYKMSKQIQADKKYLKSIVKNSCYSLIGFGLLVFCSIAVHEVKYGKSKYACSTPFGR